MARLFLTGVMVFLAMGCGAARLNAADRLATESDKIEALISHVEAMKQARFVRNGKEYDAKIAGRFLRYLWNANEEEIETAEDFIRVAGTASGAGIPYLVRFQDGRESKSRDFLTDQLKKLESARRE